MSKNRDYPICALSHIVMGLQGPLLFCPRRGRARGLQVFLREKFTRGGVTGTPDGTNRFAVEAGMAITAESSPKTGRRQGKYADYVGTPAVTGAELSALIILTRRPNRPRHKQS